MESFQFEWRRKDKLQLSPTGLSDSDDHITAQFSARFSNATNPTQSRSSFAVMDSDFKVDEEEAIRSVDIQRFR
jgi:hypothetical protein